MRQAVFVVPYRFETSMRFLSAALALPDTRVGLVSADPLDVYPPSVRRRLTAHWQVRDPLDPDSLEEAVVGLRNQMGGVDRLVGVLEQLQVPMAVVRERLDIPGLDTRAAHNFRDKARMKDVLAGAGLPCARHALATSREEAVRFIESVGLPVVLKPPAGAGAVNTFRVDDAAHLGQALDASRPSPQRPVLIEEFMTGREHSFDSVCVDGQMVWHSISHYEPTPLAVMENAWIQWCVLLPRDVTGPEYEPIRRTGAAALAALGMQTGLSHMEWFRRPDGSIAISEVGARPPGAQITTLLSHAHATDMYAAWARLMIHDVFDPPERRFATGAAYLRGQGRGRVVAVHGLDEAQRELGELVVEAKLPERGQPAASSYEGEGYVILRHPDTRVVAEALMRVVSLVRVELG